MPLLLIRFNHFACYKSTFNFKPDQLTECGAHIDVFFSSSVCERSVTQKDTISKKTVEIILS